MLTFKNTMTKETFDAWANKYIRSWMPDDHQKPFGESVWYLEVKGRKKWKFVIGQGNTSCVVTRLNGKNQHTVLLHLCGDSVEMVNAIDMNGRARFAPKLLKKYQADAVLASNLYRFGWMRDKRKEEMLQKMFGG